MELTDVVVVGAGPAGRHGPDARSIPSHASAGPYRGERDAYLPRIGRSPSRRWRLFQDMGLWESF
jgi:hypothetical protein